MNGNPGDNFESLSRTKPSRLTPTKPADRLPPHSIEGEQGVLGCILQAPGECLGETMEKFKAGSEVFYDLRHRTIYDLLVEMFNRNESIDMITVQQRLKDRQQLEAVGGLGYLSVLPDSVPSAANLAYYVEIVREKHMLRLALKIASEAVAKIYESDQSSDAILNEVEHSFLRLREDAEVAENPVMDSSKCAIEFRDYVDDRIAKKGSLSGFRTGFYVLDRLTDGLQRGELTVLAARPSVGKTAIACNLVQQLCFTDMVPTLFVSCEMSPKALSRRLCSAYTEVTMRSLRTGKIDETDDIPKLKDFMVDMSRKPYYVVNGIRGMDSNRLSAVIRRMVRKHGIQFVVLDYMQKVRCSTRHEKRTYEVGEVSTICKSLAEDCQVAFLALAQLNREPSKDKGRMPRSSDLADSGQIERDADNILLLHRDDKEPQDGLLIVAKQRDGEAGLVKLSYQGTFCKFSNPIKQDE